LLAKAPVLPEWRHGGFFVSFPYDSPCRVRVKGDLATVVKKLELYP
jgi:hypothetical protein